MDLWKEHIVSDKNGRKIENFVLECPATKGWPQKGYT